MGSSNNEPADSRTICKSTRDVSIDTLQAAAIDSVNQESIDNKTTPSINITCEKAEKVEVLILSIDENGVQRDEEGRARNSSRQLIHTQVTAIPDDTIVDERDDFELTPSYISYGSASLS